MGRVDALTVGEALARFRRANSLPDAEHEQRFWTCRLGAFAFRLPNFAWRRAAIAAHDLHHVLTGHPCTLLGECHMAAWEFGAGSMPHWAATTFCLPLVLAGFLRQPGGTLRAFLGGRASRSLHGSNVPEPLLAGFLSEARREFPAEQRVATISDRAAFAFLVLKATLLTLSPLEVLVAIWIAVTAA
jgi:hypothetical protein